MSYKISLSVHQLVDSVLRGGDIDTRIFNSAAMIEGSRIHRYYQQKMGKEYLSEVFLHYQCSIDDFDVYIEGRADGIIIDKDEITIDEIKSCIGDIDEFHSKYEGWHLGQAKVYAFMYCVEKGYKSSNIVLTYISQEDKEIQHKHFYHFSFEELEFYFQNLLTQYLSVQKIFFNHKVDIRNLLNDIKFPYPKMNKYQDELIDFVFEIEKHSKNNALIEAPTGIGKTVSTLYPSLINLKKYDRIFYLTAKNSGKEIVKNTLNKFFKDSRKIKATIITAKEKICPMREVVCNPDECPFARNYYDKLSNLLLKCFDDKTTVYDANYFMKVASENIICPFEFQLDFSLLCDVVVGDYNYIFDPFVYLERYVDNGLSDSLLLLDEGHNLIDRVRGMYSISFGHSDIKKAKDSLKQVKNRSLKSNMTKIMKYLENYSLAISNGESIKVADFDNELFKLLNVFCDNYRSLSLNNHKLIKKDYKNCYMAINKFLKLYELMEGESFAIYYFKNINNNVTCNIMCTSPTKYINNITNRFKNSLIFSATLTPFEYYNEVFFNSSEKTITKAFDSPFNADQLCFNISPFLSIKYKDRMISIDNVVSQIVAFMTAKIGNYFVFVPSYEYLNLLKSKLFIDNAKIIYQEKEMNDQDKDKFVQSFEENSEQLTIGVCVLGGSFSESINLVGNRLIGVVVIGVGMPSISFENNEIKNYYESLGLDGFYYAYLIPGMKNVTQAVGRLIRSTTDRGGVLLIDSRYNYPNYKKLFRKEWKSYKIIRNDYDIINNLNIFYKKILNK